MLTEEEAKRIAAEERYRHEIRKSLAGAETPATAPVPEKHGFGKKLFEFLNSSVGMWLLSSVVLTGGAAMLQQIQHNHEIAQKNRQDLTSHKFEIQHRLDSMTFLLRRAKTVGEAKNALNGVFKSSIPLTPELQNRSLASLYMSIQPLLAGTEKQKTTEAFELVKQLEESELLLQAQPDDKPLGSGELAKLTKVIAAIQKLHFTQ
ncbi:MAG: hypothetical protein Q8L22_09345 [Reyranella sp.]|nr:hypothetical protein [Reyranella sp.]